MNGKDTALFSKASDEWSTPQWLFDLLDQEFQFHCDASATEENTKCPLYMGKPYADALKCPVWCGYAPGEDADYTVARFWLNPPYSKIAAFMQKAYEESRKGATVVCLIPARTDTRYWHDCVMKAAEIRFIKGRLKFGNSTTGAPFPKEYTFTGNRIEVVKQIGNAVCPVIAEALTRPYMRELAQGVPGA